jgi:hypothetical protein
LPDYNPAIAAQIQPPAPVQQPNFVQTLSQAAEIQRNQAATSLANAQALQATRKYNGLLATSQALANKQSPTEAAQAGAQAGGDPGDITSYLNAWSQANFMGAHNGQNTEGALAGANIARAGAETANARAQLPGLQAKSAQSDMEYRGGIANALASDTSDDNWKTYVPQLVGHVSPQGMAQILDAYKNPEKRPQVAKNMIAAALPPADATKLETTTGGQGVTSPLERLSAPVGNTQAPPQTGQTQAPGAAQPVQPGLLGARPPMSPGAVKFQEGASTQNLGDLKEANEKYHNAAEVQSGLMQIQNNLDSVPQGGWYTTGTDAGKRVALAKGINTALEAGGLGAPFDKGAIASAEAAQKGTVKLGFDLARSLGSREAQMIVQQSIGVQPGMEMTEQGNRRIMTGLMTAAQRDKDYTQFFQSYAKQNPNMTPGEAQISFNQAHPPSEYVGTVNKILSLPKAAVDDLRKNPKLASQFDAKFGGGDRLSRFVLGN